MSKFNGPTKRVRTATGVIVTERFPMDKTFEGAPGYARDAKSELFLLAVTNMVGEDTFYESGSDRDKRFRDLVQKVAVEDVRWMKGFLRWLRESANMRSASVVGALEAAAALIKAGTPGARQLIDSVLVRADEPGEALAYWLNSHGRRIPQPVKRGIADAAERLYTEFNVLKYDTASHAVRFADVLDLTHPKASLPGQGDLFKYVLARRHGRDEIPEVDQRLPMILANTALRKAGAELPGVLLDSENLRRAGMTWEDALSLVGSKVSKKALWEELIPSMGYMAQLRNLRNFDEAGVSKEMADRVAARLADPREVAKSRQFPFRFLSAFKAAHGSLRWGKALEEAVNASLANIPELPGRTLVLVDCSGSMWAPMSARSELQRWEAAALFGSALALRNGDRVTLVRFGSGSEELRVPKGHALLSMVNTNHFPGMGGTYTAQATQRHYSGHDRVVIITDEQAHDGNPGGVVPANIPVYTWNLAGYKFGHTPGLPNRYTFGGLTDQAFQMIPLLERGESETWPWE